MLSVRPGILLLAALAALLLSGCASSFDDAGVPPSSIYGETSSQAGYPPVEKYPVTQARNQQSTDPLDEISVTDLQPSPEPSYRPNQSVLYKRSQPAPLPAPQPPQYQPSLPTPYKTAVAVDAATLIQQSRSNYSGNCPCPYDRDRAGRRCGGRSAYSRAGGASVLCYPSDVTTAEQSQSLDYNAPAATCGGSGYGAISCITGQPRTTYVSGYYRKNGTYVKPYYRSKR